MISKDFFLALDDLEKQKGIDKELFLSALENALSCACKKNFGEARDVEVKVNPEKCSIKMYAYKTVVEEVVDEDKEILLSDAQLIKQSYKIGDKVVEEIVPKDFGRIAAQTAKQVVMQTLREAERNMNYSQYVDKENELLIGVVSRVKEDGTIFVEIGKNQMEGILLLGDQSPGEKFNAGDKIKVLVKKVKNSGTGAQVVLNRNNFAFIKRLFENEIPEIRAGIVEIKSVVREAGFRTKIAVYSTDRDIDAVGACVGNKGVRVNAIVNEIGGEKIDIIPWSEDILDFIARSLSPAQVLMVQAYEETKEAKVIVADDKLSLAIGKEGQNARLAARLTGWKIDVKSYSAARELGLLDMADTNGNENEQIVDAENEFDTNSFIENDSTEDKEIMEESENDSIEDETLDETEAD